MTSHSRRCAHRSHASSSLAIHSARRRETRSNSQRSVGALVFKTGNRALTGYLETGSVAISSRHRSVKEGLLYTRRK